MRLPVWILLVAAAPAAADLNLDSILAVARPSPERLAEERFLTDAARELALSRGVLGEGMSLTAEAGPRRSPGKDGSDLSVALELPLAGDRAAREAALDLIAEAERVLPAAAELEAALALRLAYVDAWEASEGVALARRQAASAESWLELVETRVAAGAEAPYESALVGAEIGLTRLALAEARAQEQKAWSELRARAAVEAEPVRLAEPVPVSSSQPQGGTEAGEVERSLAGSTLARAIEVRSRLVRALIEVEAARGASRWSLLANAAQEGDEDVARLGLGYRLPLAGENAARTSARDAALAEEERGAELARTRLVGRLRGAEESAAELAGRPASSAQAIEEALEALEARVTAGRDRPSAVLPLRRQLVDALLTELTTRAARARSIFLIQTLQAEMEP